MIDAIVAGARIYDGLGAPPFVTDLGIVGERIALIGALEAQDARLRIDARGLALAPGFIDTHAHSDELWLVDPRCLGKLAQGVTTEIGGNCGRSAAPLFGPAREAKQTALLLDGLDPSWESLDEFLGEVARARPAINVATLVGHGTVRRGLVGDRPGRLDDDESAALCATIREAVEAGALGLSSGLAYVPSRFADTEELIACSRAARDAGAARYATHLRDESAGLLAATGEALAIGEAAEVAVVCSHHKAAWQPNWGLVHRSLAAIERARARGHNVAVDCYPYVAMWTELATILPEDALAGGREATLARLRDPRTAAALTLRVELDWHDRWEQIRIASFGGERNEEPTGATIGRTVAEIARERTATATRTALALLAEARMEVEAIFFAMSQDDVATVLSADFCAIGSDASARACDGPTARGLPHPRTFGTFPRVVRRFVFGRRTFDLAEAIRRMTSFPAALFGLRGRGRIAPGAFADLVLFDPERLRDTATYEQPYAYPEGVAAVFVNGRLALRDGAPTGERAGRVLRGG
ncbi:MAG: N-acyl-D-amino-acid deacylase family protein [Vulcanimicrobiaceae bacterium]